MTNNVQPVRDNQQIRCTGLKSVGDQKKQENLANKLPQQKVRKRKTCKRHLQDGEGEEGIRADFKPTPTIDEGGSVIDVEI